jgi:hypothetical protein
MDGHTPPYQRTTMILFDTVFAPSKRGIDELHGEHRQLTPELLAVLRMCDGVTPVHVLLAKMLEAGLSADRLHHLLAKGFLEVCSQPHDSGRRPQDAGYEPR